MRETQPPIMNEAEYQGYQQANGTLTQLVTEREQRLFQALASGAQQLIEDRRFELLHVLRDRQAIIDAIHLYEEQHRQIA